MKADNSSVMVTVRCLVYNHEPYIRNALDGFVMQKTNFRFEVIVHDDCSTDHSADIIREYEKKYPDIIKPIYETENQYSKGPLSKMRDKILAETRGKYIALCEGDDYWTDPYKLQKQVDFLESHPEYTLCFHTVAIEENGVITRDDNKGKLPRDFSVDEVIQGGGGFMGTCSLAYRAKGHDHMLNFQKVANIGDYPLQIRLALEGKVHYIPDKMGVYRFNHPGSWTARSMASIGYSFNKEDRVWMTVLDDDTHHKYAKSIHKILFGENIQMLWDHKGSFINLYKDLYYLHGLKLLFFKSAVAITLSLYKNRIVGMLRRSNKR